MFTPFTLIVNHYSDDMKGIIPHTDSRYRMDIKCYELGQIDQAEVEKNAIELRQRLVRKWIADGKLETLKPNFFKEIPHPHLSNNEIVDSRQEKPVMFKLIENEGDEKGYWERREKEDWADLPNLWGPWDDADNL